jgi:hypothetical protein
MLLVGGESTPEALSFVPIPSPRKGDTERGDARTLLLLGAGRSCVLLRICVLLEGDERSGFSTLSPTRRLDLDFSRSSWSAKVQGLQVLPSVAHFWRLASGLPTIFRQTQVHLTQVPHLPSIKTST